MNSFFCEDTKEEEQLLQKIIKVKEESLPKVIFEIVTNKCLSRRSKGKEEKVKVEPHLSAHSLFSHETHDGWSDQTYVPNKEEQNKTQAANGDNANGANVNAQLQAHVFPFHLKKNGHVNADTFFIPYKSHNDKDVITEYTYSYSYYDVYTPNIENTNKLFNVNNDQLCDVAPEGGEAVIGQKHVKVKQEKEDTEEDDDELPPEGFAEWSIQKKNETRENEMGKEVPKEESPSLTNANQTCTEKNMQKFLVHFRGRLFIGCNLIYSHFKCNTFLCTIQSKELDPGESTSLRENDLQFVKKEIQTYNLINNAIYWKQDEYPDVSDPNIQKFLFLTVVPALCDFEEEGEQAADVLF
ncbi:hypothetical protein AK88_01732 [Plasmodium fragile]|uniref:Uncharacterized protein n=1 Tax=Plasmodium fragile TaxID=5857 RepID=A0A0D9QPF3_PLAFR|nr:uncharacterized protein AK88_01732 [Plasmodium fragile]KJP88652.1 hypothetical protein AK88_01732 [Plasmodium fragile]